MSEIIIYHNPRCSKSRQTLALLEEKGIQPKIVEYLQTPPNVETLEKILTMLGVGPEKITRTKEEEFVLLKNKGLNRAEYLKILVQNPKLIERPIVVNGNKAAIGRPPENVLGILYVIFVGGEEVSKRKVKVKDMATGEERLVSEKGLVKVLGGRK